MTPKGIVTAVIPAAGFGRRIDRITGGMLSKEMLPTPKGPVIGLILDELATSSFKNVVLVVRPENIALRKYIEIGWHARGAESAPEISFLIQRDDIGGNGAAILTASEALGHSDFFVAWCDEIFVGGVPRALEVMETFNRYGGAVPTIALTEVREHDVSKCGMARVSHWLSSSESVIVDVVEKPDPQSAPSNLATVGGCVMTSELVEILKRCEPSTDGELYLSTALSAYARSASLIGRLLSSSWHETGTPEGYISAFTSLI